MKSLFTIVLCLAAFGAAFAVHQWWKGRLDLGGGTLDDALVSAEDLLQNMQDNVSELATLAAQRNGEQAESKESRSVQELITATDASLQAMQRKEDGISADLLVEARVLQLNAYFIAQVQQPHTFSEQLIELCRQLEQELPDSPSAFQASALRFAGQHDLTRSLDEEGFEALMDQANNYQKPGYGAALFSFVSRQLHSNGQDSSAKQVLMAGLDRYRGQSGWHDLFQQQFAQGYLKAPESNGLGDAIQEPIHTPAKHGVAEFDASSDLGKSSMKSPSGT